MSRVRATPPTAAGSPARVARLLCAGALATFTACASAPPDMSTEALAGCYFFQRDDAAESLRLPDGVRLTETPLEGWPAIMQRGGVRVAVTLTPQGPADYPFGYWLVEEGDSVELGYPAGGGIVLDLAVTRDLLQGTARVLGDVRTPDQPQAEPREVPVRLDRRRCP